MKQILKHLNEFFFKFIERINIEHLWIAVFAMIIIKSVISIFFIRNFIAVEDWIIAQNLADGSGYTLYKDVGETAIKVPVYPLFLFIMIKIFGTNKIFIVILQHIIMSFSSIGIYKIGKYFFPKNIAIFLGLIFLLHPSFFYYSNVLEVSNLFIPVFIIGIILFLKFRNFQKETGKINLNYNLIIGALSGVLFLLQPIILPVVLALIFIYLLKKRFIHVLLICISALIVISPWIIRNYYTFDKFIPMKSPFWMNFYVGYMDTNPKYGIIPDSVINQVNEIQATQLNDVDMENKYREIIYPIITNNISLYIEKTINQMYLYWRYPPRYENDNSLSFLLVRKIPNYILTFLFIFSLVIMFRRNKHLFYSYVFLFCYFTVVYGATSIQNIRFKLDIEWLEIIALGFIFMELISYFNPNNSLDKKDPPYPNLTAAKLTADLVDVSFH